MKALLGIFDILPGWVWAIALAAAVAMSAVTANSLKTLKLEAAESKAHYAEVARKAEAANRNKERLHSDDLSAADKRKADETRDLALAVVRLHGELRNRPERPASGAVPKGAADPVGCTGAQLYKPDAAFLVGESARADGLRIALNRCQAAYDSAVKLTNP